MKKLIKTVDLIFFCDNANGEYGVTHKETYNQNDNFNPFWDGVGIFHDIFEHSHEHTNKYFKGDYAMNLGGELAAMGSMWYYIDTMNIYKRSFNDRMRYNPGEVMRETTCSDMREAIREGYCRYGFSLESNVPRQSPVDNESLEEELKRYWAKVKDIEFKDGDHTGEYEYDQEHEFSIQYKNSVSFRKIADLHRYGYRMAQRLVPDNWENIRMLNDFIEFWDHFTKSNDAEDLMRMYQGMRIDLYKEKEIVTWKAFLVNSNYGEDDFKITTVENVHKVLEATNPN